MKWSLLLLIAVLCLPGSIEASPVHKTDSHGFKALVFSKTDGFRHTSIETGIATIQDLAADHSFEVVATENASAFTDSNLSEYDVVIFLNTTGDILDQSQQDAFERFIRAGGGFVGIHSAADTEYDWPFYGELVGGYFDSHPQVQEATILVADNTHPSTASLPERWVRQDEWYNYRDNPRGTVHVLATLDESSYTGGTMGVDHPTAWCHIYEGGRSWYTGGGHSGTAYAEPLFRDHLLNGIEWAAGVLEGECGATIDANWEKAVLDDETNNPIDLAISNTGDVYFVELGGKLKVYDPVAGASTQILNLDVYAANEHGLLGIELDPDFDSNGWLYLFYSPANVNVQRVSRFTISGKAVVPNSESVLLAIPTTRNECCHAAGSMSFDNQGNLIIATGDDTNPFDSNGYAPIDERTGRQAWDAQRTSANTNDLRGKILRITPQENGTYIIPAGNLFPSDGSEGRPEIYAMGLRNPFRISVDPTSNWIYWGDVGPDANGDDPARGPRGYDEWNQARAPGNFGWPYCIGQNFAYRDYDFEAQSSGSAFDCSSPSNDSPNNTGAASLPPAMPAWIWYPYGPSTAFPAITDGPGRTSMAGPVIQYSPASDPAAVPEYFDRSLIIYEWSRNWVKEVRLDENGDILSINPMLGAIDLKRPIAMELSPSGVLYAIEWGTGFGGDNNDSQLIRIDYRPGAGTPVAVIEANPTSGPLPLTVSFSASDSYDPGSSNALTFDWDLDGDGNIDQTGANAQFTYTVAGTYLVRLTATDSDENVGVATATISAGNTAPTVTVSAPRDGGFFAWGDSIAYSVEATDAEDGSTAGGGIDCSDVHVQVSIGHDDHSHPLDQLDGCEGAFEVISGHGDNGDNLFYVFNASYTDQGGAAGSLTSSASFVLHPTRIEAEHFTDENGVAAEPTGDVLGGGSNIGFIDNGDYIVLSGIDLHNINGIGYRIASAGPGGKIEVRVGSPTGLLLSTALVEPTGGWQVYRDVTAPIDNPGGKIDLYFVFKAVSGSNGLFNVNWIDFFGEGLSIGEDTSGLKGEYFNEPNFGGRVTTRTDPRINFNWGAGSPLDFFPSDNFSVRWSGILTPERDEAYRFFARTSDGVRVWLANDLIIDEWADRSTAETFSAFIPLTANQPYDLVVEYYESSGEAQAHLDWTSFSTPRQAVPSYALTPAPTGTSIDDENLASMPVALASIYPNPAADLVQVETEGGWRGPVQVEIVDILGRDIAKFAYEQNTPGKQTTVVDVSDWASGPYFFRISDEDSEARGTFVVRK